MALGYLLPALTEVGVTCGLIVSHRPDRPQLRHLAGAARVWDLVDRGRLDLKLVSEISEIVRAFQPDVLHSHGYKGNLIAWLLKLAHKVPIVTTLHGYTGATQLLQIYEGVDHVVVVPRFDAIISLLPDGPGTHYISNGIDPDDIIRRSRPSIEWTSSDGFRLIGVGRMSTEKGYDVLITALSGLGDLPWRLCLVGDGPALPGLRSQAEQAGLSDRILFTGAVDNPLPFLAGAGALAHPSHREQCPLVVLEAMALGKIVLANAVGAVPHMISHERTGWLVRPGDAPTWQEALVTAWQSRAQWKEMGDLTRARVKERFHILDTARRHLELYSEVASR
jgi:glycosyltransferase involved in cell wall biosynthesis